MSMPFSDNVISVPTTKSSHGVSIREPGKTIPVPSESGVGPASSARRFPVVSLAAGSLQRAYASNQLRALQQFFKWLAAEKVTSHPDQAATRTVYWPCRSWPPLPGRGLTRWRAALGLRAVKWQAVSVTAPYCAVRGQVRSRPWRP
jgi:hypothetical protein